MKSLRSEQVQDLGAASLDSRCGLYFFYEKNTGIFDFHVEGGSDGRFPLDQAAGLLAMHCVVRRRTPKDYVVMVQAPDEALEGLSEKTEKLLQAGRSASSSVRLTRREEQVLGHVMRGLANKEIAALLNLSVRTVKLYVSKLLFKFHVCDRTELVHRASGSMRFLQVINNHKSGRAALLAKGVRGLANGARVCSLLLIILLALGVSTVAASLSGRVMNGTTRKPASGDDVILLTQSPNGMDDAARTRTDNGGHFSFPVADPQAAHMLRVVHQGVGYELMAQSDAPVAVEVYDVAAKLEGVSAIMDVQRFEAVGDKLEIKQLITMRNDSGPPRTLLNDRTFEIEVPPEAEIQSGLVQVEDGQPLKQTPTVGVQKGQYYFVFPVRPGDTRFGVVYRLAYKGEATIEPTIRNPHERFVVMLPKSMNFEPQLAGIFQPMQNVTPDNVLGTGPVTSGQNLAFRVSGTGMLAELRGRQQRSDGGQHEALSQALKQGLGREPIHTGKTPNSPHEAPVGAQERDSFILAGLLIVVLAAGIVYMIVARRAGAHSQPASLPHE